MRRHVAIAGLALATAAVAAPTTVVPRAGLPNFVRSLASGESVRLVAFGGTATAARGPDLGRDLPDRLSAAFRQGFPKGHLRVMKQGVTQTGSWLGAFRTDTEAVQHYVPLGLVVVEFAADDADDPPERILAAVEGIVRKIRRARPTADILFLHGVRPEWLATYRAGGTPEPVAVYERVADHYGIPSIHVGAQLAQTGSPAREELWPNGQVGEKLLGAYAAAVSSYVAQLSAETVPGEPVKHKLPKTLCPRPLESACLVSYEKAKLEEGWLGWQESPLSRFFHVVHCTRPGPTMTLAFQGDSVGLYAPLGAESADFETSLDGADWQRLGRGEPSGTPRAEALVAAEKVDPDRPHELRVRLRPQNARSEGRLAFFLVNGKAISDDPYRGLSPLQKLDAVYATMDPVDFVPNPDRWQHLPKTMDRLANGPDLTIVMLGDSIVNDTAHSEYQHLLMRRYPKCQIHVVRSVRGSTGCWWYKDENRVKSYVLDHNPQLLMIGGISQRNDTDSIRAVIHQVRAASPDIEVMLMTGAFGSTDPRKDANWTYDVPDRGDSYRTRLRDLAAEENAEFLDMTGPWGRYIRHSRHALGSFKRDVVHANDRGKQILGRVLDAFFAPKRRI